jgi:hypothetical protein
MSFERSGVGSGVGAEQPQTGEHTQTTTPGGVSPALRLQILSTEHWSLLASRSLAWNESFSRTGMFLSTLSGAIVALALVAQASAFGEGFTIFALVILPVVLFVGVTTYLRLSGSNYHDVLCVVGMNRIRAAYLELAPELARYFVMSAHDDVRGVQLTQGVQPGGGPMRVAHFLAATPVLVVTLNGVIGGVIVALLSIRAGAATVAGVGLGAIGFMVVLGLHSLYARRMIALALHGYSPLFPETPEK